MAKKTTISSFLKTKFDLGIITLFSRKIAPILISSGKFEFFNSLFINSEVSIISASITSYYPLRIVYAVSIVPLCICLRILETVFILGSIKSSILREFCNNE